MRIWTTQTVPFWNQLQSSGVIYCDSEKLLGIDEMKEAYDWMADQMTKRVGPPPSPDIKYPIWGWQQVGSYKKEHHPNYNDCGGDEDEFVFITANIPNEQVLLSDFMMWHHVLNHCCIPRTKKEETDNEKRIIKSWELIFDLNTQHWSANKIRRNRWIQATFWELKKEWVVKSEKISGYQNWVKKHITNM